MMKGTSFYPSFFISIIFGLATMLSFSAYMIYYFIVNTQDTCYQHVSFGIIALACLYPLESILIFICLVGSAGASSTKCWKFVIIIFFGLLVSGLGFGGLGIIYICILNNDYTLSLNLSFATNETFIQIIVYTYLSFIILYLIMVPLLTLAYNSRQ